MTSARWFSFSSITFPLRYRMCLRRSEEGRVGSDWSSDVCSSDLLRIVEFGFDCLNQPIDDFCSLVFIQFDHVSPPLSNVPETSGTVTHNNKPSPQVRGSAVSKELNHLQFRLSQCRRG